MKNIKYPLILFLQLFVLQLIAQDQTILNNGRPLGALPEASTEVKETLTTVGDNLNEIDDADITGTYYLRGGGDDEVVYGDESPINLLKRLDNLENELQQLRLNNEQLAKENQAMKMEMSNCCAEASTHLNSVGSYLMQNSPNPFQSNTNIQFFIEDMAQNAKLELRNVEGVLIQTYDLKQRGIGELRLDRSVYNKGSYIYTLSVDGKIIDSKVMIIQ